MTEVEGFLEGNWYLTSSLEEVPCVYQFHHPGVIQRITEDSYFTSFQKTFNCFLESIYIQDTHEILYFYQEYHMLLIVRISTTEIVIVPQ